MKYFVRCLILILFIAVQAEAAIGENAITSGPDGNLWHLQDDRNNVARITTMGTVTQFPIPTPRSVVGFGSSITTGPDGNLWFTESSVDKIGRITPTGSITEFSLPLHGHSLYIKGDGIRSSPTSITAGPDGNLWFTDDEGNSIGRITVKGRVTKFSLPKGSRPNGIAAGPDGNLWFTNSFGNKIGRITVKGAITYFTTPTADPDLESITSGPDGNLWFTEYGANKIGRITAKGRVKEFPIPTKEGSPASITVGPHGNLWFIERADNYKICKITMKGIVTEYPLPKKVHPASLTVGPDGNLWFSEGFGYNKIGRITTSGAVTEFADMSSEEYAGYKEAHFCDDVVKRVCKEIQPGGGRLTRCLREHENELPPRCKTMISIPKKARLIARVRMLHKAVMTRDAAAWYAMLPPYEQATVSLEAFKKNMGLDKANSSKVTGSFHLEKICYPCMNMGGNRLRCVLSTVFKANGHEQHMSEMWEYVVGDWYWGIFGEFPCGER